MKILNTKQFNEKLRITPLSQDRIRKGFVKICHTVKEMRENLQTGDIAIIHTYLIDKGKETFWDSKYSPYISYKDLEEETYTDMLDKDYFRLLDDKMKDGVFLSYHPEADVKVTNRFGDSWVSYFDDNFVWMTDMFSFKIMEIRRIPKLVLPLTLEYFENPPIEKSVLVWKRK